MAARSRHGRIVLSLAACAASACAPDLVEAQHDAGPAFDCSKAGSTVEELVCADAGLAELDQRLARTWQTALSRWPDDEIPALRAAQRGWIKGRNDCWKSDDIRACVQFSYRNRITELEIGAGLIEAVAASGYACDGLGNTPVFVAWYRASDPPAAVVTVGDDQVVTFQARAASGARYKAPGVEAWEHQGELALEWFGSRYVCQLRTTPDAD